VRRTGAEAFRRDNPKATVQFLDTGHLVLEMHVAPTKNLSYLTSTSRRSGAPLQSSDRIDRDFRVEIKDESGGIVAEVQKTIHVRKKQSN
jgi:hypothetical protein